MRQMMSAEALTHEMADIKEQLAQSAAIRADTQWREWEAEEEVACSQLRLNNLEIALRNVQCDTERRVKRTRLHSEREAEPAAEKQQKEPRDKQCMLLPPNLLGTMGNIDDTLRHQNRSEAGAPAEETRSLLQTI
jgi:hypothetical protein